MEIRSQSQTGPLVPALAELPTKLSQQLDAVKQGWLDRLNRDPASFARLEVEIHDHFRRLADQTMFSARGVDPYVQSHPMPMERVHALEELARPERVREIKDPAQTRVREGDEVAFVLAVSLKSNLVFFSNFGTAYVTRFNDVPPSTGYGDPIQKLFKFDDNERVVYALSLDPRLLPERLCAREQQQRVREPAKPRSLPLDVSEDEVRQRPRRLMPSAPTFQLLKFGIGQSNFDGSSAHAEQRTICSLINSTKY